MTALKNILVGRRMDKPMAQISVVWRLYRYPAVPLSTTQEGQSKKPSSSFQRRW